MLKELHEILSNAPAETPNNEIQQPKYVPPVVERFNNGMNARSNSIADHCYRKAEQLEQAAVKLRTLGDRLNTRTPEITQAILQMVDEIEDTWAYVQSLEFVGGEHG